MTFTEVKELPKRVQPKPERTNPIHKSLIGFFDEFVDSGIKLAKVNFTDQEYANISGAYSTFHRAINTYINHPIKVKRINGELYLIRTDM